MERDWRRFAPIGLYVALVAVLFIVGYYVVQRKADLPLQIGAGVAVIGIAASIALDPDRFRRFLMGRQAKYGSNALLLAIAFVGILVVVNYIVYQNVDDWKLRWDLTEDKENTLAAETVAVLETLPDTVVAKAFFTPDTASDTAEDLLDQYAFASKGRFEYEFINPNENPTLAQEAGIDQDGTVVLYMGDQKEPVEFITEEDMTGALIRLMNPGGDAIYFLTGHGEFPLDSNVDESFGSLKAKLEAKNYIVQELNLLATNQIPDDATVIVMGGGLKPITEAEMALLSDYLQNGGGLVLLSEPLAVTEFGDSADPMADYLLASWGIRLSNDIVVDLQTQQAFIAYAAQYADHPITQKMRGLATAFPTARSVLADAAAANGVSPVVLIYTSENSWAETDIAGLAQGVLNPDEGIDTFGPISLGVVAEDYASGAKLVVIGDSEFASNAFFTSLGNGDMIVNSIDWAAGQEDLISLTAKEATQRVLVTPKVYTLGLIFLGSLIILPGMVVVGGIAAWIIRRRRG
ncbi:MAG: GldG family protein [Anaerolineales bacterium]|nr:GldG family protein [Anaerolineales bacterium]